MKIKALLTIALLSGVFTLAHGQVSRPLPVLQSTPDTRSAALGNVAAGDADAMYIYSAPGAFLFDSKTLAADFSAEIFPKYDGVKGRTMQYNLSGAYKFLNQHALLLGFRYQGGHSVIYYSGGPGTFGETVKPFDWALDLGYAYRLNEHWAFHASANLIASWIGKGTYSGSGSFGAQYREAFSLNSMPATLDLTAKVSDLGGLLTYSDKMQYALPSSLQAAAAMSIAPADDHKISARLGSKYYFLPADAKLFVGGLGLEYGYGNRYFGRLGYELGGKHISNLTAGLGARIMDFHVDLSYRRGMVAPLTDNIFILGIGYQF